jgi:hypothetical protein
VNIETGRVITRAEYEALQSVEREAYRLVPQRLAADAEMIRACGASVYVEAPRSPLARFGKQALRAKTRANKIKRRQRRR